MCIQIFYIPKDVFMWRKVNVKNSNSPNFHIKFCILHTFFIDFVTKKPVLRYKNTKRQPF